MLFDDRGHARTYGHGLRGQRHLHATLVMAHAFPLDQARLCHARQHTRDAGAGNEASLAQLTRLQPVLLQQRTQDAPLLFGHALFVQRRTKTLHQRLAGLE